MQHRIHRLSGAAAAVLFLAATAAGAVSSGAQKLPPAQEVIDRYVEAIGGAEAIRGHSSTHGRGTMELMGQGIRGEMHFYAAAGDKSLLVVSLRT